MKFLVLNFSGNSVKGNYIKVAFELKYKYAEFSFKNALEGSRDDVINTVVDLQELTEIAEKYIHQEVTMQQMVASINLKFNINDYDEIIIGAHGIINCVDHCFWLPGQIGERRSLFTAEELANFLSLLLMGSAFRKPDVNIQLAICYAARTSNYMVDHADSSNKICFVDDSFAGKFLKNFDAFTGNLYNVCLTACIGAVSYNHDTTGELLCESEEKTIKFRCIEKIFTEMIALMMEKEEEKVLGAEAIVESLIKEKDRLLSIASLPNYGQVVFQSNHALIHAKLLSRPVMEERQFSL